ncbi:DUF3040 domain-containing protein [Lapillicoccus sp.]|uniref:DUF3040 domain-containing protein n=1 Tax=Lapillicoccus sp. TaxID=1909287 RepID=UPI0027D0D176|nr:DUF3040 domain-containing protein [Actinomycetota bacterium]
MPLSEHEQKVLQAMEQALYAEDPRFATHITNHGLHPNKRRIVVGVLAVIVGLGLVMLAALNQTIWLGAVGFALMVAGGAWAFSPAKKSVLGAVGPDGSVRRAATGGGQRQGGQKPGFMQRLEARWDRRRHDEW